MIDRLLGRRRAGSWVRKEARRRHLDFWRLAWREIAALGLIPAIAAPVLLAFAPPFAAGFAVGGLLVALPLLVWIATLQATGTAATLMGGTAEEWTGEALRKLLGPHGWHVVDDLPLESSNVDHVAIGPGGALAVETKWSAQAWKSGVGDRRVEQAASAARRGATRLRGILRGCHLTPPVRPLVVLWGEWDGDPRYRLGGDVDVVKGPHLADWAKQLPNDALRPDDMPTAMGEIRDYVQRLDTGRPVGSLFVQHSPGEIGVRLLSGVAAGFAGLFSATLPVRILDWRLVLLLDLVLLGAGLAVYRRYPRWRHAAVGWITGVAGIVLSVTLTVAVLSFL